MERIVSLRKCDNYEYQEVENAVNKMFEDVGGIEKFAKSGDKVLLKVNLLNNLKVELCATTHPVLVEIVAKKFIELGCEVIIGDSSAGFYNAAHLNSVYKATKMTEAAKNSGAKLNDDFGTVEIDFPEGKAKKKFEIISIAKSVDVVVNMAKLKTHQLTMYTGCAKNLYGLIPGMQKVQMHSECNDVMKFTDFIIDINESVKDKIKLNIIDAVMGMEGNGPSAGTPRKVGVLVASESSYAADLVGINLMNAKIDDFPLVYGLRLRDIKPNCMEDIKVLGEDLNKCKCVGFKLVKDDKNWAKNTKKSIFNIVKPFKKVIAPYPYVSKKECKGCEKCKEHCPNDAITMVDGKATFDIDKCIRCFCCQELCPFHLIKVRRSLFYRIIKKL